jgi:hypothetical protein
MQALLQERDADLQRLKMVIKLKEGLITRLEVRRLVCMSSATAMQCHCSSCHCHKDCGIFPWAYG